MFSTVSVFTLIMTEMFICAHDLFPTLLTHYVKIKHIVSGEKGIVSSLELYTAFDRLL